MPTAWTNDGLGPSPRTTAPPRHGPARGTTLCRARGRKRWSTSTRTTRPGSPRTGWTGRTSWAGRGGRARSRGLPAHRADERVGRIAAGSRGVVQGRPSGLHDGRDPEGESAAGRAGDGAGLGTHEPTGARPISEHQPPFPPRSGPPSRENACSRLPRGTRPPDT